MSASRERAASAPLVKMAARGCLKRRLISLDDGPIGAAPKPPLELAAVGILVRVEPRRKPECENVPRRCHHRLSSSVRSFCLPGRAAHDWHLRTA
jgi:hypothetical protein